MSTEISNSEIDSISMELCTVFGKGMPIFHGGKPFTALKGCHSGNICRLKGRFTALEQA